MKVQEFVVVCFFCFVSIQGETTAAPGATHWVNAQSGLALRSGPSRTTKPLMILPYGSAVQVIERSASSETIEGSTGQWFMVSFGKTKGWVFSGFLVAAQPRDTLFAWNESKSHFLIQKNLRGNADDCGNGFEQTQCEITVYSGGKVVLRLREEVNAEWRSDREITVTSGMFECVGGGTESRAIDVLTRKNTGSKSWGMTNLGCGMPDDQQPPISYTMCSGTRCVSFQKTKTDLFIYLGLPDYQSPTPFGTLRLIGRQRLMGIFAAAPTFDALIFENGNDSYEIDHAHSKIRKRKK